MTKWQCATCMNITNYEPSNNGHCNHCLGRSYPIMNLIGTIIQNGKDIYHFQCEICKRVEMDIAPTVLCLKHYEGG